MNFRNSVFSIITLTTIIFFNSYPVKANIGITAGHLKNTADSLALTIASDAKLILMTSPVVDTTGKSIFWNYVYISLDSIKEYHFSIDSNSVKYDSSRSLRIGIGVLDSNWIDSDSSLYLAESNGGYEFRILHPNSNIKASLYRPVVPPFNNYWDIQYINDDISLTIRINALNSQVLSSTDHKKDKNYYPISFALFQNYPNPFNPRTQIQYSVPVKGYISLKIYNLLGQEIMTLFEGVRQPGNYTATFDAKGLSSGVYLYRLTADHFVETKKLILLK
jgi:hypothetical protein